MATKITLDQLTALAQEFNYPLSAVRAFLAVESGGAGFNTDGKIIIQFEPHIFKKYTGKTIVNGVEGQAREWEAFNQAWAVDRVAAMLSTSWGMGQVMGFNYKACGFQAVGQMVDAFKTGELAQVRGMLNFIKSNQNLRTALRNLDWKKLAYNYNGSNYAVNRYDQKLQAAYARFEAQK